MAKEKYDCGNPLCHHCNPQRIRYGDMGYQMYDNEVGNAVSKSKVWTGIIKASYTGYNVVEMVMKYVEDVVAMDEAGARTIVTNLFDSVVKKSYPKLELIEVTFQRNFSPVQDKGMTPKLVDVPKRDIFPCV